ncbi:3-dehydroquinate dehydratase [Desulfovibrio sp. OttesenSCG-928-A18]|nr:3-dehydroquinate dehydratase [Desulfovibrio sp. OttesenSCG-928-A18]
MPSNNPLSILVMNGPNLVGIGERQPDIYGTRSLESIPILARELMGARFERLALSFFQNNSEGRLIDRLEQARSDKVRGIVFNAGAYTHTSLALADCVAWIGIPVVEVHISNVFARDEPIRRQSYLAAHSLGVITGFGLMSYALAIEALYHHCLEADAS